MIIHDFVQSSPEWHAHRATHLNASDVPAMLGISPYKTRSQLLDEMATGISQEFDEATQRRFADGHRFEALARPLAEHIIGKTLYPVVGSEGKLSASFDGLTMDETICFEHKSLNNELKNIMRTAVIEGADLPELYRAQMEQQLMISGARQCLFMASSWDSENNLLEEEHCFYNADHDMRDRILQGWTQFAIDLGNYKPRIIAEKPKAEVQIELPALYITAHGAITSSNMEAYGLALKNKLAEVRAIKLITDQDFSNAKEAAKMFREQCQKLNLAKEAMLAQTVTIGEAARMMDAWHEDLRVTALQLEKNVEKEDLAKKRAMVTEAGLAYSAHIEALEIETRPIQLNIVRPDFAAAIKGKRNYASMQDAIDTALANGEIAADAVAKDVRAKMAWFTERTDGMLMLFPDLPQIIIKPLDDFKLFVEVRIEQRAKSEAEKMARIQSEATAKAEAKAQAEVAEQVKAQLEVQAKAIADTKQNEAVIPFNETVPNNGAPAYPATKRRPTKTQMIEVIAGHYGVSVLTADEWLRNEFEAVEA